MDSRMKSAFELEEGSHIVESNNQLETNEITNDDANLQDVISTKAELVRSACAMDKSSTLHFRDKIVIVTGASSGIGAQCAIAFAKCGATLTLVGRDVKRLQSVAEKCKEAKGITPLTINVDLTKHKSCELVVDTTVKIFRRMDVLVNCAGRATITSLFDNTMEHFDETFAINLKASYRLMQLALPHLKKTKGNIINIIGANFEKVRPGFLPYSISMAGLETLTKSAALELAPDGVRVNAIRPGITKTNFLHNLNIMGEDLEFAYARLAENTPSKRVIQPEEIAKMVIFVASDTCPSLTGAFIDIDGAASMS
ncbi:Uncharacterized oxidoreductase TM_0325 [Eumeta japonica]|uniref:Uncharacterized oxidoreductase TM_0325 n=1 Tax=Eumeta variegata TaxID=151549 RepID=A0A4C1XXP3_EUMVA|nr:Uncharacterized oxidoreductase TM_0325 [Eumeta japonica]